MRRLLAGLAQWWHGLWTFHPQSSLTYMEGRTGHLVLYCDRCGRVFLDELTDDERVLMRQAGLLPAATTDPPVGGETEG